VGRPAWGSSRRRDGQPPPSATPYWQAPIGPAHRAAASGNEAAGVAADLLACCSHPRPPFPTAAVESAERGGGGRSLLLEALAPAKQERMQAIKQQAHCEFRLHVIVDRGRLRRLSMPPARGRIHRACAPPSSNQRDMGGTMREPRLVGPPRPCWRPVAGCGNWTTLSTSGVWHPCGTGFRFERQAIAGPTPTSLLVRDSRQPHQNPGALRHQDPARQGRPRMAPSGWRCAKAQRREKVYKRQGGDHRHRSDPFVHASHDAAAVFHQRLTRSILEWLRAGIAIIGSGYIRRWNFARTSTPPWL